MLASVRWFGGFVAVPQRRLDCGLIRSTYASPHFVQVYEGGYTAICFGRSSPKLFPPPQQWHLRVCSVRRKV